jgi:hypothetical protein
MAGEGRMIISESLDETVRILNMLHNTQEAVLTVNKIGSSERMRGDT